MRPPLAGKRAAARRLAQDVRRRLEPVERMLPVKLPGFQDGGRVGSPEGAAPEASARVAGRPSGPTPEEGAARIDAARERLRATIEPPAEPDA